MAGSKSSGKSTRHSEKASSSPSSSANKVSRTELPRSVRYAPPELRAEIRRKQNSDSARRIRERRKHEEEDAQKKIAANANHIENLEKKIEDLQATLDKKRKAREEKGKKGKAREEKDRKKVQAGNSSTYSGEHFEAGQRFFGDPF